MDFRHTITVILPSVTRTLDNSNLPLTRTNFRFPSGHFLYNFTLANPNHVCQYVTLSQNKQCTVVKTLNLSWNKYVHESEPPRNAPQNTNCATPLMKADIDSFRSNLKKLSRVIDSYRLAEKRQGVLKVNRMNSVAVVRSCSFWNIQSSQYLDLYCCFALFCFTLRYVMIHTVI